MPEIKNQFTKGKMNKDLDERLIPKGEYKDAMNIQVSTSEDSDVGTVQNILGNKIINVVNPSGDELSIPSSAKTIASIADEKNDTLYYLVWSPDGIIGNAVAPINWIISYKKDDNNATIVFTDINNIFQFESDTQITGINIIDDMMFWTDNRTEPKKINITRSRQGTAYATAPTVVVNEGQGLDPIQFTPTATGSVVPQYSSINAVETKHITVIKKPPATYPSMRLKTARNPELIYTGFVNLTKPVSNASANESSFRGSVAPSGSTNPTLTTDFSGITTEENDNTFNIRIEGGITSTGALVSAGDPEWVDNINQGKGTTAQGLTGWQEDPVYNVTQTVAPFDNIKKGLKIVFKPFDDDGTPPGLPITDYTIKGVIEDLYPPPPDPLPPGQSWYSQNLIDSYTSQTIIKVRALAIEGTPPVVDEESTILQYAVDLYDETEKLFEFKFPRFSYRYKYEDGEYSTFAPWTQVAFQPGSFDYHPRKGYNLGMTNRITSVELYGLVTENTPKDVISIDILFKDEPSPNVYVVDTIRPDDHVTSGKNKWDSILIDNNPYTIKGETVNNVVASNQLLRPWDNVPRKALAQDITGSRIVYGNYIQNYNLEINGEKFAPDFKWSIDKQFEDTVWDTYLGLNVSTRLSESGRSIKSLREYQLGVVFVDKYGRETPVISNDGAIVKVDKSYADKYSRFTVGFNDSFPDQEDLKYYKIYVKETSGEYYNMAMDRFYDAEDGNIWLAFPSSDRNKIDIDTFLILKKGSDTDDLVTAAARYKVIAIENEAPDYIKTKKLLANSLNFGASRDLYGTTIGDGPFVSRDQFSINYKAFHGTTGMNLDKYQDGELYIEWENQATQQRSDRYRITSIEHDFDESGSGTQISLNDAKYYIHLDRNLGNDILFITNDSAGLASTKIEFGTTTNIYKYEVENSPKFDGRFFVKIHEDEVFQENIGTSFADGLDFKVLQSRKIYHMKPDHIERHTSALDDFLVDGDSKDFSAPVSMVEAQTDPIFWKWGYYAFRNFAANAMWFRRYAKGNMLGYITGRKGWRPAGITLGSNNNPAPFLARLDKVSGSGQYWLGGDFPVASGSTIGVKYPNVPTGQHWACNPGTDEKNYWWKEFGAGSQTGHTHNFSISKKTVADWDVGYNNSYRGQIVMREGWSLWDEGDGVDNNLNYDKPLATDVWFVDEGPYAGACYEANDLDWINLGRWQNSGQGVPGTDGFDWEDALSGPNNFSDSAVGQYGNWPNGNNAQDMNYALSTGIQNNNAINKHKMELAYGGIGGAKRPGSGEGRDYKPTPGFFNFGLDSSSTSVENTYHEKEFSFIQSLKVGSRFRWKEDPTGTVYIIGGDNVERNIFRHSTKQNGGRAGGKANDTFPGVQSHGVILSAGDQIATSGITFDNFDATDVGSASNTENYKITGSVATSMAEHLSFNFSKNIRLNDITPSYENNWDPFVNGLIPNSLEVTLTVCDANGGTNSASLITAFGQDIDRDLKIYVTDLVDSSGTNEKTLHNNMAFNNYTSRQAGGTATEVSTSDGSDFYVIRHIEPIITTNGVTIYELILGGYEKPLTKADHELASDGDKRPKAGTTITFKQVGMNGYSHNSEFNINTLAHKVPDATYGAITAVGYNIEMIEQVEPEEILSDNPAIFETEPKETKELDIYFEATGAIPLSFDEDTVYEAFPIGTYIAGYQGESTVVGYNGVNVILEDVSALLPGFVPSGTYPGGGPFYYFIRPDGLELGVAIDNIIGNEVTISPVLYNGNHRLAWHNCFSFGNGVESNRIRDNFNLPFIANGVKASTTLEFGYEEEHRKYGLIYSGIYNSVSGLNSLNQFIQAEKITKDVNPTYGSIQKLHSRNSDLVALCEDKVLKILANKDAVFNADGNTNLTATENVLGQTIPFSGEFGISTNPESFASENYRAYFTDKVRGKVLRLSMDGLTPISDVGMKDWFKDNLKITNKAIGSYDDKKDQYNVTLKGNDINTTITYKEDIKGWVSFKSFTPENAISCANEYYTFNNGKIWRHHDETVPRNTFYDIDPLQDTTAQSSVTVVFNDNPSTIKAFNTLNYEGSQSKIDKFSVETKVLDFQPNTQYNDQEYYNLASKLGWYVGDIVTDKEQGSISEFLEKEGKWFNNINRNIDINLDQADTADFTFQGIAQVSSVATVAVVGGGIDPNQTLFPGTDTGTSTGTGTGTTPVDDDTGRDIDLELGLNPDRKIYGCTDPNADNYDATANIDDGSCVYTLDPDPVVKIYGCTDPNALNYDATANVDDGSCQYRSDTGTTYGDAAPGCMDPSAVNYNPLATYDDGSCVYEGGQPRPKMTEDELLEAEKARGAARQKALLEKQDTENQLKAVRQNEQEKEAFVTAVRRTLENNPIAFSKPGSDLNPVTGTMMNGQQIVNWYNSTYGTSFTIPTTRDNTNKYLG